MIDPSKSPFHLFPELHSELRRAELEAEVASLRAASAGRTRRRWREWLAVRLVGWSLHLDARAVLRTIARRGVR